MDAVTSETSLKMDKAVGILQTDLGSIRAGRATASLVEHVRVKVYGGTTELSVAEVATITSQDAKTLLITPFDNSVIDELDRGLQQANLGLTIAQDGEHIRVVVPPLTQERREEFAKLAKTKSENIRIMIRQIRQDAMSKIRDDFSSKLIGEDVKFRLEKDIQKVTDDKIKKVDELLEAKITELTTV